MQRHLPLSRFYLVKWQKIYNTQYSESYLSQYCKDVSIKSPTTHPKKAGDLEYFQNLPVANVRKLLIKSSGQSADIVISITNFGSKNLRSIAWFNLWYEIFYRTLIEYGSSALSLMRYSNKYSQQTEIS